MPQSLKVVFAVASDLLPIGGYKRRPWMMIGFTISSIFLLVLSMMPLPRPYYCFGADGQYDLHKVCDEEAKTSGTKYMLIMMLVAIGVVITNASADALTVSYGRREPIARRGKTQVDAYTAFQLGNIVAALLVGLGMNGPSTAAPLAAASLSMRSAPCWACSRSQWCR